MSELLKIDALCAGYGRKNIIDEICFSSGASGLVALMGPNGCGKTTLLRAVLGLLRASSGHVLISGEDVRNMGYKARARKMSFIPQASSPIAGFSAEEIIAMGRHPHDTGSASDRIAVEASIVRMNLQALRASDVSRISGGEYQRVLIARALAQETGIMLLDEPTAHLDIKYRLETMRMLKSLKTEKLIIGVFHDIDLVGRYADRVVMMKSGRIAADGDTARVLTDAAIREIFDI
jgi:ABC-type cobalamin/Fe3+-siderophores transport system ATPase subunit